MIMGELRRYLHDSGSLRVSRSMRDTAYHAMKAKEELTVKQGRIEKGAIDSIKREL